MIRQSIVSKKWFSLKIFLIPLALMFGLVLSPMMVEAAQGDDFNVTGGTLDTDYTYTDGVLTFLMPGNYVVSMTSADTSTTRDTIVVNAPTSSASDSVNITLNSVSIDVSGSNSVCAFDIQSGSTATITLAGANRLLSGLYEAGLHVPGGAALTLQSASSEIGTLTAYGYYNGSDRINYARGGAGVGGNYQESSGTITINSGTVNATGGNYAAGIGGGSQGGAGGYIAINGGTITVMGTNGAAGIGGGYDGAGGTVDISGGIVDATGYNTGIGSGNCMANGRCTVIISGGDVTAKSLTGGAGIGTGPYYQGTDSTITISGGIVTATASSSGAGIGGGLRGSGGTITVSGGTVNATGGSNGAGIGGGNYDSKWATSIEGAYKVTISGGTVTATGGSNGAGIGGGNNSSGHDVSGGTITVSGGTVTATGGSNGAGIGGGSGGGGGAVAISGGSVLASGGSNAEDIGAGAGGNNSGTLQNDSTHQTDVYLTTVTLDGISAVTAVSSLTANLSDATYTYGTKDMYTDTSGKLYLYLPNTTATSTAQTDNSLYSGSVTTTTDYTTSLGTLYLVAQITGVSPGGTGNAVSGDITITFSQAMDTSVSGAVSLDGGNKFLSGGRWSAGDTVYTLPYSGLSYDTSYTVSISDFADMHGNTVTDDTYRFTTAPSSDAALSGLVVSEGTLSPAFASNSYAYTVSVANGVSNLIVTPTANDTNATVTVNGTAVSSGAASDPISLAVGENTVTVAVTAQDGTTTQAYTVTVTRAQMVNPFGDVTTGDWFYDNVMFICENGLMKGTATDTFDPNGTMTRAMFATVLYRLSGDTGSYTNAFSDVPSGAWYESAAAWAAANGITVGVGNGRFDPYGKITREQFAVMIYRYAQYKGYDVTVSGDLSSYGDADKVSDWASDAMKWAVSKNIIKGTTETTLSPAGNATRAQAAAMLQRFIENVIG